MVFYKKIEWVAAGPGFDCRSAHGDDRSQQPAPNHSHCDAARDDRDVSSGNTFSHMMWIPVIAERFPNSAQTQTDGSQSKRIRLIYRYRSGAGFAFAEWRICETR
jgi:hypothetical protein